MHRLRGTGRYGPARAECRGDRATSGIECSDNSTVSSICLTFPGRRTKTAGHLTQDPSPLPPSSSSFVPNPYPPPHSLPSSRFHLSYSVLKHWIAPCHSARYASPSRHCHCVSCLPDSLPASPPPPERLNAVVSSHSNAAGTSHSQHNVSQASTSVHFICICKSIKSYQTFPRLVSQLFLSGGWFTSAEVPRPDIFACLVHHLE